MSFVPFMLFLLRLLESQLSIGVQQAKRDLRLATRSIRERYLRGILSARSQPPFTGVD